MICIHRKEYDLLRTCVCVCVCVCVCARVNKYFDVELGKSSDGVLVY